MPIRRYEDLSSRERQIMDIIYRRVRVTVAEVREDLRDAPSESSVRTMLSRLEGKGFLKHSMKGPRNVYTATTSREGTRRSAVRRLMETFFDNSAVRATAAVLDRSATLLSEDDFDELQKLIEQARRAGR